MQQLTRLVCPTPPPPSLPSGVVVLFKDDSWSSAALTLTLNNYRSGVRQSIAGTSMQDQATFVSFNLPKGTVVTLMDDFNAVAPGQLATNLANCGRCVDLVGTGQTEGISLIDANMNDCVSAFFWRIVDIDLGAIVIFEDANYLGNRSAIFLGEWPAFGVNSIAGWYLADRVSSADWSSLSDRQMVSLFDNADGTGIAYSNINGWGQVKNIPNFTAVSFNDVMSSFSWTPLAPMKEIIQPFTMNLTFGSTGSTGLSTTESGTNSAPVAQGITVQFNQQDAQTLTVSSTETITIGVVLTYTETWKVSVPPAETGGSLSLQLSQSYTNSQTNTASSTTTISLNLSQTVTVGPACDYVVTWNVQMGQVPETTYETTATRWYDQPVTGGIQDPANNNWWKRVETVTGTIAGGLACSSILNVTETPLAAMATAGSTH
jgi:hypothetical protein